jgi:hypothetical protein
MYKLIIRTNNFFNHICRSWTLVAPGDFKRKPNGVLGILLKRHYPDVVVVAGEEVAASTWEHYVSKADILDRAGREFDNKAERVLAELWVSHTTLLNT